MTLLVLLSGGWTAGFAQPTSTRWDERLKRIDDLLVEQEYKKAYSLSSGLVDDILDESIGGPGVSQFLGVATVLRAIACVGLDRVDEAKWHWLVAIQVFPEVASYRMTAYGDAGSILRATKPRGAEQPSEYLGWQPGSTRAKKLKAPVPRVPTALSKTKLRESDLVVFLNVVVGEDGRLRDPLISETNGNPVLVVAAHEAARRWRYRPATNGSRAIPVSMLVSIRFQRR